MFKQFSKWNYFRKIKQTFGEGVTKVPMPKNIVSDFDNAMEKAINKKITHTKDFMIYNCRTGNLDHKIKRVSAASWKAVDDLRLDNLSDD